MRAASISFLLVAVIASGCAVNKQASLGKAHSALSIAFEASNQASTAFQRWEGRRVATIAETAPSEDEGKRLLAAERRRAVVVDSAFVALYTAIGAASSVLGLADTGGASIDEAQKALLAVTLAYKTAQQAVSAAKEAP